jgi:hypothetical protein
LETKLIPGEALIYERDDKGTVYARYRDPPHNTIPRWVIGSPAPSYSRLGFSDISEIQRLAKTNLTFAKELDKLLNLYYILKESKS